jgi:transposase-like protein
MGLHHEDSGAPDVNAIKQRIQFIAGWLKKTHTVSDLCALYGISHKSGYKWIDRYFRQGPDWVLDRSHSARVVANKTPRVRLGSCTSSVSRASRSKTVATSACTRP